MKLAILIGLNHYPNAINNLRGCVNDVDNWDKYLNRCGYDCIKIKNEFATKKYVVQNLEEMVEEAEKGDSLVFQYSGHGTQIPCYNNDSSDEADGKCEAICLYDQYLIDNEIEEILSHLEPRANLTIISDSCFSGNLTRNFQHELDYSRPKNCQPHKLPVIHSVKKQKKMFKGFDDQEQMNHILLSGCRENETSADGCFNGIYEGAFSHYALEVLNNNKDLTVEEFYERLRVYLPNSQYYQHPQLECSSVAKEEQIFV